MFNHSNRQYVGQTHSSSKRTALLQILSLIVSLQRILAQDKGSIESSDMEYIKAGLAALVEKLDAIDKDRYALYISIFTDKLQKFNSFYEDKYDFKLPPFKDSRGIVVEHVWKPKTLPRPLELMDDILNSLEIFKIEHQDFLSKTMRDDHAAIMFIKEDLTTLLTCALQRIPEPADSATLRRDWDRGDFASVNGESFNSYKKHFPYSASLQMIKNFCRENGLDEQQTSFVLSQAHQNALGGLLAYTLEPFRNNLDEKNMLYSPSFIDGNIISIKGRPGQPLVLNCRAILYVKNNMNARDVIPLAHIGFTMTAHNITRKCPEIRVNSELVHGSCFLPARATIKFQFAFIDQSSDPYGLKQLLRDTFICGENHIASIAETFLPLPPPETSFMFDEPALVPLILDREFLIGK
jgi:hypothetical protein